MSGSDDRPETPLPEDDPMLLAALRDVDALLPELAEEAPPPELVARTLRAVREDAPAPAAEPDARGPRGPRIRPPFVGWLAAALLLLGLGAGWMMLGDAQAPAGLYETADRPIEAARASLPDDRPSRAVAASPSADPGGVAQRNRHAREMKEWIDAPTSGGPQARKRIPHARNKDDRGIAMVKPDGSPREAVALLDPEPVPDEGPSRDAYSPLDDNPFLSVADQPRSTFSVDVDTASYSNVRRFLREGRLPPADAVRIEELINYFPYGYEAPKPGSRAPFSVTTELGPAPWAPAHRLVHIGLQAPELADEDLPPRNLVFLLDVSGSMNAPDKLGLLQASMALLVETLTDRDRVAIVVYAGAAGVVLPPTSGDDQAAILEAIDRLRAGGSTNGGQGIRLAYDLARRHFVRGGINRVILGTDGDFNVGTSSEGELKRLVEEERKSGVFLTVLGFGRGNLQDDRMETLADHGNGNYAYLDSLAEAKKVLVAEAGGTLVTVAKDVKIQVEWNPLQVAGYRLIGYVNRKLADRDFADDTKDAGEIGAGHSVTALYEVVPVGGQVPGVADGELRYQRPLAPTAAARSGEALTVRLRWKQPDGDRSELLEVPVRDDGRDLPRTSEAFRWSAAVAGWGMTLRGSAHRGDFGYDAVIELAEGSRGADRGGYRAEFLELVELSRLLAGEGRRDPAMQQRR